MAIDPEVKAKIVEVLEKEYNVTGVTNIKTALLEEKARVIYSIYSRKVRKDHLETKDEMINEIDKDLSEA